MRGFTRDTVHEHMAFVHQRLNPRAAQLGELRDEKTVKPLAGAVRRYDKFEVLA